MEGIQYCHSSPKQDSRQVLGPIQQNKSSTSPQKSKRVQQTVPSYPDSDLEEDHEDAHRLAVLEQRKAKQQVRKVSRSAISAQAFGIFNKKPQVVPKHVAKDEKVSNRIKSLLTESIIFANVGQDELDILVQSMEQHTVEAGELVIRQGDQGDVLYIVDEGQLECFKSQGTTEIFLKNYSGGEVFGQLALLYNSPRAASIRAKTKACLYSLDRSTFVAIVQGYVNSKRQACMAMLAKVQVLESLSVYEKDQLCDVLKEECFSQGEYIIRQNETGDRFYMVKEGQLVVQRFDEQEKVTKIVYKYYAGDYFGEIALIKNTVRQASVKAFSKAKVVSVDRDAFKRLLGPIEPRLRQNLSKYTALSQ